MLWKSALLVFHLYFCDFIDLHPPVGALGQDSTLCGVSRRRTRLFSESRVSFGKAACCKAMMSCSKGSFSSCDITTMHVGVETTLKWFCMPSVQRLFAFVLFFASFLSCVQPHHQCSCRSEGSHTLFVDVPRTFLPFCWTCLTSPWRPPVKMSKRLKKKRLFIFYFFNLLLFLQKGPS